MLKFAVIGDPITHSLSPLMYSVFFDYYHLNAEYTAIQLKADEIKDYLDGIKHAGLPGLNVTIPHKVQIIRYLDAVSEEAQLIGAVNCIQNKDGVLIGHNTDMKGFEMSLPRSFKGGKAIILGAGGAARSVLIACIHSGCRQISIFNRTSEKADRLRAEFFAKFPNVTIRSYALDRSTLQHELHDTQLFVNATSIGMISDNDADIPIRPGDLHRELFVYDIVYNPPITGLIQIANQAGVDCLNGLDMLIYQGLESLKIWLNKELPFKRSLIKRTKSELMRKLLSN